ncbi:MAG: response regulator transcription factor [Chloroflexota bacterium]
MTSITITVVDDHPLFRQGVVNCVSLDPKFDIVGEASNGNDALTIIREKKPQVVVLDINLPDTSGLQIAHIVRQEGLPSRIILVTAYDDLEQKVHAMRSGAFAYCTKDINPEELIANVYHVLAGKYVVNGKVLVEDEIESLLNELSSGIFRDSGDSIRPLSRRETEVLSHVAQGMSNKEIAILLEISYQTVKNHVTAILQKLSVKDRTQAAVYALRRGWFRLND